jgi:hypothetical protein
VLVHKTTPSLSQYATNVSITKHYEINSQILAAFESSYDARRYHVAYAIGRQFVETALLEIPKHGYFYAPRHERERMQSSLDAVRVATMLQEMQQQAWGSSSSSNNSSEGGGEIRLQEYEKMQKLKALAVEQVERASEDQYEAQRAQAEREIRNSTSPSKSTPSSLSSPSRQQQQQPQQQPWSQQKSYSGIYSSSNETSASIGSRKGSSSNNNKASRGTTSFRNIFGRRGKSKKISKSVNEHTAMSNSSSNHNNNNNTTSATTSDTDSADSWIVLDGWIGGCPESFTNVLCPHGGNNQQPLIPSPTQVVLPPLPPPPPPPGGASPSPPSASPTRKDRKDKVKKTNSNTVTSSTAFEQQQHQQQRESALSAMPTLAVAMPVEQRSRTAPPGGRTRKQPHPQHSLLPPPLPPPPLQRQELYDVTTEYRETMDDHHHCNNDPYQYQQQHQDQNPQILSRDWQVVNGEGAIPLTPHVRQHSADEILLERALYLSGLEIAPAPPPPPLAKIMSAGGAPYMGVSQQHLQQQQQYGAIPEDEIMTDGVVATTSLAAVDGGADSISMKMINKRLELATLKQLYHEDFDQLRREGRIRVAFADTFQGRLTESTNGCTVIAPLLCMHHLLEDDDGVRGGVGGGDGDDDDVMMMIPDPGLPDNGIVQVIDKETPAILNELRTSLGLSEQAFLIPADVHDYLIENGQLHQSQFVNVVGGNILDEDHLQNLFQALEEDNVAVQPNVNITGGRQGKLAATLFFHEHVVAILKLRREPASNDSLSSSPEPKLLSPHSPARMSTRPGDKGNRSSEFWYDLIDSLPLKETLTRVDESDVDFSRRLGLSDSDEELSQAFLPMTARIRCLDAESMRMCIRWYACSKFTPENCQFIDTYEWDDAQSDFDPRVFQAFIWGSA